jgi:hypothetical protein
MTRALRISMLIMTFLFAFNAIICPLNLHSFLELAAGHPLGNYWSPEGSNDHQHYHGDNHHHSSHSEAPIHSHEHELADLMVLRPDSKLAINQDFTIASLSSELSDYFFLTVRHEPPVHLILSSEAGPPSRMLMSMLRRSCPETAPPGSV